MTSKDGCRQQALQKFFIIFVSGKVILICNVVLKFQPIIIIGDVPAEKLNVSEHKANAHI